jgi:hypothetical protein
MKTKRNLSRIYFRSQDPETKKWGCRVFEDLSEEEQDKYMTDRSEEWLKSLAKQLANTLNLIGDQFDIMSGSNDDEE